MSNIETQQETQQKKHKLHDLINLISLENAIKYNGKANAGAVLGKLLSLEPSLKEKITLVKNEIDNIISSINSNTIEQQKVMLEKLKAIGLKPKEKEKKEEPKFELPNAKNKKVVMRLAPYPSGPLHIGNAITYVINDELCKKYKGRLLLVMDDTIGSKEKQIVPEAYKLIPEGLKWLGVKFTKRIIYKSDRLKIYYKYAKELIKKDAAYVCFCSQNIMHENRNAAKACECRSHNIQKNLSEFENMLKMYKEGEATLRLKTPLEHPNPAFRDRVIMRICSRPHPRVKKRYRVWPLLDFSWAIDDHLLNITHIVRGKDLMIESDIEKFVWDIFGWEHCEIIHTALVNIEGVKLSKTKARNEVLSGKYFGWDDPRTWSLQSLQKRGFLSKAVRNFCLSSGMNPNEKTIPIDNLYAINRKLIDKNANRFFFIEAPLKIEILNMPSINVQIQFHPDFKSKGFRKFKVGKKLYIQKNDITNDGIYRLMHLCNFKKFGNKFEFLSTAHEPSLNAIMLHWLPATKDSKNIKANVLMPDGTIKEGLIENSARKIKIGETAQFERFGFCKLNRKLKGKLVFWFAHR